MREKWPTIVVCVAVALVLLTYLVTFQVNITECAIHYRWGSPIRIINAGEQEDESGWYFKLPYPIDTVWRSDRRVRALDGKMTETQLKDASNVIISMYASWRISNPVQFKSSLKGDEKLAAKSLKDTIFSEASETVGQITFDNLVSTDEEKLRFDEIEEEIARNVSNVIREKQYGIEITSFGVRRIALPQSTTQKVFKRMIAERHRVAEKRRKQGQSKKETIIAEANRKKEEMIADAIAQAKKIRGEADAAEAQFYEVFAKAPELAIFLRRLEALRNIAKNVEESDSTLSLVLGTKTEPFRVFTKGPLQAGNLEEGWEKQLAEEIGTKE